MLPNCRRAMSFVALRWGCLRRSRPRRRQDSDPQLGRPDSASENGRSTSDHLRETARWWSPPSTVKRGRPQSPCCAERRDGWSLTSAHLDSQRRRDPGRCTCIGVMSDPVASLAREPFLYDIGFTLLGDGSASCGRHIDRRNRSPRVPPEQSRKFCYPTGHSRQSRRLATCLPGIL